MSERKIANSLGISRNTLRTILSQAQQVGLTRSSKELDLPEITGPLFKLRERNKRVPGSAHTYFTTHHEQIKTWLLVPSMTATQMMRLLSEEGKTASESSLRRYIRKHFPSSSSSESTVHLKTQPGHQAQVDFASVGLMKDPVTQKMRKAYAFIMTLSHSRYRFVRFVFGQNIKTWIDCHIRAFHFFGGITETIMPDNLKSAIQSADFYDPILNRTYGELEKHYGFVCDPTKVRTPRHKGKVERSVTLVRQQVLAGRCFKDSEEANAYALHWCRYEIALRPTRTTGRAPWEMFIQEEKALLKPLPLQDYECPLWQELKVHRDHHVVFEGSFYSVPTCYIGKIVWLRASERVIEIYLDHQKIKTHVRTHSRGQWVTDQQDYPPYARGFLEKDKDYCLKQAQSIGSSTHQFLSQVLKRPSLVQQRKAQAILRLEEKYGSQRLEAACQRALSFDNDSFRSLKGILVQGLEAEHIQKEQQTKNVLPRQASYLRQSHEFQPLTQQGDGL
jgi:transposase